MLDLRRLQTFREVVARRSFSEAALALDYTQSTVSQQITTLERELGATLVNRARRPIAPTAAGELLLARADALLGQAAVIERELAELSRGAAGTVRLGGFFTAWATFMPGAVEGFSRDRPGVSLELTQLEPAPALAGVRDGSLDLAVVYRYPGEDPLSDLGVTPLLDDRYSVALPRSHRLATREGVGLADLSDESWTLPPAGAPYTELLRRMCLQEAGFEPRIAFETHDIAMAQPLVAAGLAVSLLPALGLVPRHAGVVVRPLAGSPLARQVVAVRPPRIRAPVVEAMQAALVHAAARHRASG